MKLYVRKRRHETLEKVSDFHLQTQLAGNAGRVSSETAKKATKPTDKHPMQKNYDIMIHTSDGLANGYWLMWFGNHDVTKKNFNPKGGGLLSQVAKMSIAQTKPYCLNRDIPTGVTNAHLTEERTGYYIIIIYIIIIAFTVPLGPAPCGASLDQVRQHFRKVLNSRQIMTVLSHEYCVLLASSLPPETTANQLQTCVDNNMDE